MHGNCPQRFFFRLAQHRQQKAGQDRNNGEHHQEFDQ